MIYGKIGSSFWILLREKERNVDPKCQYNAPFFELGEQKLELFFPRSSKFTSVNHVLY